MRSDVRKNLSPAAVTLATAHSRLDGAIATHMLAPAVATMIANALARHALGCRKHVLNEAACAGYNDALDALGVTR